MALVPEDGTGVVSADTYRSVADADTYFAAHGSPSAWTSATTAQKESALRYSATYLDSSFEWPGQILNQEGPQALAWPRAWAWDREGRQLDGVPSVVADAQCELAVRHLSSPLNAVIDGTSYVKRQKVGSVEREFQDYAPVGAQYRFIEAMLSSIVGGSPGSVVRLVRT